MQKQYKARQSVGRFHSGDIVGGLSESQIQDLLQRGVIELAEPASKQKPAPAKKEEVKTDGE
ncbi:hypothetical protein WH243_14740 [Acinetobacter sp. MYb177]|jgi:hypothetical protein|uniref:hypothetical protein n=1 Tax=Acinetobacter TaxID=469 RepID=UPI0018A0014D|nr:hypothetical protein [Acinetobacter johnsonii]QPF36510.1 hypothetical protein H0S57_08100 [Acinetobacter johnsonii]HRM32503.1 hypothetical protein [Acinetobacter johnsonii]